MKWPSGMSLGNVARSTMEHARARAREEQRRRRAGTARPDDDHVVHAARAVAVRGVVGRPYPTPAAAPARTPRSAAAPRP